MAGTAGIECRAAGGTAGSAGEVGGNGQLCAAGAAEDRGPVPLRARPDLNGVIREGFVAVLAGIVGAAALHADGNDVQRRVIVGAAGLGIQSDAAHSGGNTGHISLYARRAGRGRKHGGRNSNRQLQPGQSAAVNNSNPGTPTPTGQIAAMVM